MEKIEFVQNVAIPTLEKEMPKLWEFLSQYTTRIDITNKVSVHFQQFTEGLCVFEFVFLSIDRKILFHKKQIPIKSKDGIYIDDGSTINIDSASFVNIHDFESACVEWFNLNKVLLRQ